MNFFGGVIGLTGQLAGGKGAIADILKDEFGFSLFSLSERVREIAALRKIAGVTREILQDIGDEMRRTFGGDILAKLTAGLAFVDGNEWVVIDSIRNPAEVAFLQKHPNFTLIGVVAPRELRYQWLVKRVRPSDPKTWEEFLLRDERDWGVGQDILGQQVGKCVEVADVVIQNDHDGGEGPSAEFNEIVRGVIRGLVET